jgi:hypothetical protein
MFIPRRNYGCPLTLGRPAKGIGGSVSVSVDGEIYSCTSTSAVGSARDQAQPTTGNARTYLLSGASSCHPHSGPKGCRDRSSLREQDRLLCWSAGCLLSAEPSLVSFPRAFKTWSILDGRNIYPFLQSPTCRKNESLSRGYHKPFAVVAGFQRGIALRSSIGVNCARVHTV